MKTRKIILVAAAVFLCAGLYSAYRAFSRSLLRGVLEYDITQIQKDETPDEPEIPDESDEIVTEAPPLQSEGEISEPEKAPQEKPAQKPPEAEKTPKQKAEDIEKQISRSDRSAMMRLIVKRLSTDDINYLAGLLSGGLTPEKLSAAKKLAISRFPADELKQIRAYYKKYMEPSE